MRPRSDTAVPGWIQFIYFIFLNWLDFLIGSSLSTRCSIFFIWSFKPSISHFNFEWSGREWRHMYSRKWPSEMFSMWASRLLPGIFQINCIIISKMKKIAVTYECVIQPLRANALNFAMISIDIHAFAWK